MNLNTLTDLDLTGVYLIVNTLNNKRYVGSTSLNFRYRLNSHRSELRKGTHKNAHLQHAWSKYGEAAFDFQIVQVTSPEEALMWEQHWIDKFDLDQLYNINPSATACPNIPEVIERRTESFVNTRRIAKLWAALVKEGEIPVEEVPEKYRKLAALHANWTIPWNKGLDKTMVDYSYLKVPKTITDKVLEMHQKTSERAKEKRPRIYVYKGEQYLGEWEDTHALSEDAKSLEKYTESRFTKPRMGNPLYHLSPAHIMKSVQYGTPYKGLHFTTSPRD